MEFIWNVSLKNLDGFAGLGPQEAESDNSLNKILIELTNCVFQIFF